MNKFQVGDRVMYYNIETSLSYDKDCYEHHNNDGLLCKVTNIIDISHLVLIGIYLRTGSIHAHPKQCRKLVKKKKVVTKEDNSFFDRNKIAIDLLICAHNAIVKRVNSIEGDLKFINDNLCNVCEVCNGKGECENKHGNSIMICFSCLGKGKVFK